MPVEIERKFLVSGTEWRKLASGIRYQQGYISTDKNRTVRVRTIESKAFLTIKGKSIGAKRAEYEFEIPLKDANDLLQDICIKPIIIKNRFKIKIGNFTWEIDEFLEKNKGLFLAEIELQDENQQFEIPSWIGKEVTGDPKYFNANLVHNPFCDWDKK